MLRIFALLLLTACASFAADTPPTDHDLIVELQARADAADALTEQALGAITRLGARVRTLETISASLQAQMLDGQLRRNEMNAVIQTMLADIAAIKAQIATILGLG